MKKSFLLSFICLVGCSGIKQSVKEDRARRQLQHEVYIAIEYSIINNEQTPCILGRKINEAVDRFNKAINDFQ